MDNRTCKTCRFRQENHYKDEDGSPYTELLCSNRAGLNPEYQVYDDDFFSRHEVAQENMKFKIGDKVKSCVTKTEYTIVDCWVEEENEYVERREWYKCTTPEGKLLIDDSESLVRV